MGLLLVLTQLAFVPLHLATESHLGEFIAHWVDAAWHHHEHHAADTGSGEDHPHPPHPASDHGPAFAGSTGRWTPWLAALPALPPVSGWEVEPVRWVFRVTLVDRVDLPGESPPEPRQPRAPPVV